MPRHQTRVRLAAVLALASAPSCAHPSDDDRPPQAPPASPTAPRPVEQDPFLSFASTAPTVGQPAPAFELTSIGGERVSLAEAASRGPVVLVFASFTCPPSRMKLPRFEALAERWKGRASVYVVYSREAHPHAKSSERLNGFADQVQARDRDGDGTVTVAEYGDLGPRYMLDAFDLDHDGAVRSYEFLAARRLDQFKDIDAPASYEQRVALARQLREDVPGTIPVLVDGIDDAVATGYGGLPNMAYLVGADGRVAFKIPWAAVADIERELARLTGAPAPSPSVTAPDLAIVQPHLAAARAAHRPLLIELTATGCHACESMARTLAEPELKPDLARYHMVQLGLDQDAAWRLFESLQLAATPSFVVLSADGKVVATLQGARDRDAVRAFLRDPARTAAK
ncbi:MAG TPA: deiodinase-like protein [Kofleriaceae bacterium]|nr:deiodinase-like protein [Kofleriaceae bacterium]